MRISSVLITLLIPATVLISSCSQQSENSHPGPSIKTKVAGHITYGTDTCEWCHTEIETVRYGAELVTAEGNLLKFKAAEHLAAWMLANADAAADAKSVLVVDFADGQNLIGLNDALYLRSMLRPSPGKLHITPISRNNQRMLTNIYEAYPGTFLEWEEVVELVRGNME